MAANGWPFSEIRPIGCGQQPGQQRNQSRLAGAVRAEQAINAIGRNVQ
jgi:hypothetical protein